MKNIAKQLGENLTDEELQEMIDEADMDGDGEVNEAEFFRMMKKTEIFWKSSSLKKHCKTSIFNKNFAHIHTYISAFFFLIPHFVDQRKLYFLK